MEVGLSKSCFLSKGDSLSFSFLGIIFGSFSPRISFCSSFEGFLSKDCLTSRFGASAPAGAGAAVSLTLSGALSSVVEASMLDPLLGSRTLVMR